MWKKEISFKRKPKGDVEPVAADQPEPPVEKQSFWKKEISLSRKGKDDDTWETPATPKQSFWKKEVSLSRKDKESEVERLAQEAVRAVTPGPIRAPPAPQQPPQLAEAFVAAMPDPIEPVELAPTHSAPTELAALPALHALA